MALDLGSLELYVGPPELGGPDDLEVAITGFIEQARERLQIAVQELESQPIAEAILAARMRGVQVQIIVEALYLGVDRPVVDPWTEGGKHEANRRILSAILRCGIDLRIDLNPKTFHQKYIVRDPGGSRAAVLTGSTNFTPTGTGRNLNHIVILKSKRIAAIYAEEFEETWTGTFGTLGVRHDPSPRTYRLARVPVKILFAPDHTPELEIMKQMLKARRRVDFAMYTFAQSSGIDDAMICLHRSGVPVRGVLDRMQANQRWAATRPILNAGAELWWPRADATVAKLHHKLAVIDEQVLVVGSFNYTDPANRMNDENILVIGDVEEDDPDVLVRQQALGGYALAEIDRIVAQFSERVPAS